MSELAQRLRRRFYARSPHPYRFLEESVRAKLPTGGVLLDAGCGRNAPVLQTFRGTASRLIGVDLVDFRESISGVELIKSDLSCLPLRSSTIDVVMSRSVFEHIQEPHKVYSELYRILRPGGCTIFLTPNLLDYGTLISRAVPNRYHSRIVALTEGRLEEDVFPTVYRTNSRSAVNKLAASAGFTVEGFRYLGQYPNYLMFNGVLFFIGMCYDKLICHFESLKCLRGWILVVLRKAS